MRKTDKNGVSVCKYGHKLDDMFSMYLGRRCADGMGHYIQCAKCTIEAAKRNKKDK